MYDQRDSPDIRMLRLCRPEDLAKRKWTQIKDDHSELLCIDPDAFTSYTVGTLTDEVPAINIFVKVCAGVHCHPEDKIKKFMENIFFGVYLVSENILNKAVIVDSGYLNSFDTILMKNTTQRVKQKCDVQ